MVDWHGPDHGSRGRKGLGSHVASKTSLQAMPRLRSQLSDIQQKGPVQRQIREPRLQDRDSSVTRREMLFKS